MKSLAALLLAGLGAVAYASSPTMESLRVSGDFFAWPRLEPFRAQPRPPLEIKKAAAAERPGFPVFENPEPKAAPAPRGQGSVLGQVKLAGQLDRHRDLLARVLGSSAWNLSLAGDPAFKKFFVSFSQGSKLVFAPLDVDKLRGDGQDVTIEPGLTYHIHLSINIFNPVRGSTIELSPVNGTLGPRHEIETGALLDAIRAKSYVFNNDDNEYWLLYGTDVDPATNRLAKTRSLLFFHEDGLSSKAWPLAESALPPGQPTAAKFGDDKFVLTRTAPGDLIIQRQD